MTLTAPTPLWIDTGPIPTLTRNVLTDSGALVLLGEANGFAAAFGQLARIDKSVATVRQRRCAHVVAAPPHPDRAET